MVLVKSWHNIHVESMLESIKDIETKFFNFFIMHSSGFDINVLCYTIKWLLHFGRINTQKKNQFSKTHNSIFFFSPFLFFVLIFTKCFILTAANWPWNNFRRLIQNLCRYNSISFMLYLQIYSFDPHMFCNIICQSHTNFCSIVTHSSTWHNYAN